MLFAGEQGCGPWGCSPLGGFPQGCEGTLGLCPLLFMVPGDGIERQGGLVSGQRVAGSPGLGLGSRTLWEACVQAAGVCLEAGARFRGSPLLGHFCYTPESGSRDSPIPTLQSGLP